MIQPCRNKLADLVVLGDDPRRVDTSRIGDIEVVATYVNGRETGKSTSRARSWRSSWS
ncbi:hypothetical protein ACWEWX_15650 [Streptomyces asiaticus]